MHAVRWRDLWILLGAGLLGVAWGAWNLVATNGARGEAQIRPLVWVVFAAPFALWLGWLVARWYERGLASLVSACLYFFTFFVAARIETLIIPTDAMRHNNHTIYFTAVLVIHSLAIIGIAVWRATAPQVVGITGGNEPSRVGFEG